MMATQLMHGKKSYAQGIYKHVKARCGDCQRFNEFTIPEWFSLMAFRCVSCGGKCVFKKTSIGRKELGMIDDGVVYGS